MLPRLVSRRLGLRHLRSTLPLLRAASHIRSAVPRTRSLHLWWRRQSHSLRPGQTRRPDRSQQAHQRGMTKTPKMKIVNQILTALVGFFRPTSGNASPIPCHTGPTPGPGTDEIQICNHPRHGAYGVRRKFKSRGISSTGREFVVWQCSVPSCGEFIAVTRDSYTGQDHVLFRGHHFNPNRERPRQPTFRAIRAANPAI